MEVKKPYSTPECEIVYLDGPLVLAPASLTGSGTEGTEDVELS